MCSIVEEVLLVCWVTEKIIFQVKLNEQGLIQYVIL